MGMESYFVKVRFNSSSTQGMELNFFIQSLSKNGIAVEEVNGQYIIEKIFIMRMEWNNGDLQGMSLEGCLSWFHKGLEQCYSTLLDIDTKIAPLQVFTPSNEPLLLNENFRSIMEGFYEKKVNHFTSNYGHEEIKVLPGNPFYNHLKKKSKVRFFRKRQT